MTSSASTLQDHSGHLRRLTDGQSWSAQVPRPTVKADALVLRLRAKSGCEQMQRRSTKVGSLDHLIDRAMSTRGMVIAARISRSYEVRDQSGYRSPSVKMLPDDFSQVLFLVQSIYLDPGEIIA
jgi:hypothetical protein